MRIEQTYSHLNGYEHIQVHKPMLWREIEDVIAAVDAESCRVNTCFNPLALLEAFDRQLEEHGWAATRTDFVKDRVAVDVQFGADSSVAFELIAAHMAFYVGDFIDVGVEILAMKEMTTQMSSGVAYYEGELYNVLRQGRGVPAVPLVLIGVAP